MGNETQRTDKEAHMENTIERVADQVGDYMEADYENRMREGVFFSGSNLNQSLTSNHNTKPCNGAG